MKRHAPATARNSEPLAEVLAEELPDRGLVLEVASGSGEHAVFLARQFPALGWQPSDVDLEALASVDAWAAEAAVANLRPAITLDAAQANWPIAAADAVLCVNMVHISPWSAAVGLFTGAGRILASGAQLVLYGPFIEPGRETAPSNLAFDQSLKQRNSEWGLRNTADLDALAADHGLRRTARHAMPANNLVLVYRCE
ncbi:MAG: DUF938 domain-containing protein [Pseudomonadota bacterium]|nr:DUF938 domain-containing protein [Pseudomonadota bacterium]